MIDRINTQISTQVDRSTKKAAEALDKLTGRLAGQSGNTIDNNISIRLSSKYNENYLNARNAQDNISYLQTRDGALGSVTSRLQHLRDLAVRMGSPILNESDKGLIRQEAEMIMKDIDSAAKDTEFNSHKIIEDAGLSSLGLSGLNFGEEGTISAIDSALSRVSSKRVETGASINMLEARIENLADNNINIAKAVESRSGSLMEDIINLTDSVNRAMISVKAADLYMDVNREKLKSLLDMM